ncbi:hypothetical protein BaRGS_00004061 [Batillaria attramentaria]|uniref:Uncharacterized protein n=1 Tax=Batillaria attramentaria TaxID=370345 RepID=A0ABD0LY47_9CAEN
MSKRHPVRSEKKSASINRQKIFSLQCRRTDLQQRWGKGAQKASTTARSTRTFSAQLTSREISSRRQTTLFVSAWYYSSGVSANARFTITSFTELSGNYVDSSLSFPRI